MGSTVITAIGLNFGVTGNFMKQEHVKHHITTCTIIVVCSTMLSNLYAETYLTSIVIGRLSSIVIGSTGIVNRLQVAAEDDARGTN